MAAYRTGSNPIVHSFIHSIDVVPQVNNLPSNGGDVVTSQVPLTHKPRSGSADHSYLSDSPNSYISVFGRVKTWQFFAKSNGTGLFQVWRSLNRLNGGMRFSFIFNKKQPENADTYPQPYNAL